MGNSVLEDDCYRPDLFVFFYLLNISAVCERFDIVKLLRWPLRHVLTELYVGVGDQKKTMAGQWEQSTQV